MTLRGGVLLVASVSLVAGALLVALAAGGARVFGIYLLVEAAVCFLFVLFERSRYAPKASRPAALRPTGERSIDPVSGELIEVWEDPATGEREYRRARQ